MKKIIFKIIDILGTVLSFFNLLMFYAMRPCWSGMSGTIGYGQNKPIFLFYIPVIVCVFLLVVLIADLLLKKFFKKNFINIAFCSFGVVFLIAIFVIIKLGAKDYMRFIWPNFFYSVRILAIILAIYFLLFIYPKSSLKENNWFKYGMICLLSVGSLILLLNLSINRIVYNPVVYAVEDNYQIVFSTNSEATGWVEVGGKNYYDLYNGSTRNKSKVHKIEVPMAVLDSAKEYTIHTQRSIYCGPFGGFLGRDISKTTKFTPVDFSDGIQYLAFSDIHMNNRQASKTAELVGEYDFLVLGGDMISVVDSFDDANFVNKIAYNMTKGEMPVIYTRGNHEVKGRYAEELHKYVGSLNGKFYYTFYFEDLYGIVLDIGEDHDDDWWEYYGLSHYDSYRDQQIEFLKEEVNKKDYDSYTYHLAVCHIPVVYVNYRHNHEQVKKDMTELLNQMDIDMLLCGHQHELLIFEPGLVEPNTKLVYNPKYDDGTYNGYLTDFNFPSLMLSKPGFTQTDSQNLTTKSVIGLFVDVDLNEMKETCSYRNSRGEKVEVVNPFYDKTYGEEFVIDLNTKKFSSK